MRFFDIGVNLIDRRFKTNEVRKQVLMRAKHFGVQKILLTSTDLHSLEENLKFADGINIFTTVGVHPTSCSQFDSDSQELKGLDYLKKMSDIIKENRQKILCIGEIGLDYHPDREKFCDREVQKKILCCSVRVC